ncbi:MAG TPA: cyclic nucleotide-binding domain-containing protein [Candidatus Marinimicrobia bacterium]|nr:cyclic nucleotide-binding domain-containing protein [Candidatus Neomarinimicrobiota bacterium]HRS51023.1 cyclic nucleotide-binding domain-containing protein [Candidatus Neomarinimicrobiota bacterium]HRU92530.1 cyclic nucleotide-binding domain-containing protein [Candidatus Neomarinimicrobiota bacterium]
MNTKTKAQFIDISTLSRYEIFNGLSEKDFQHFREVIDVIEYESGDTIIKEGEVGNSILLLLDGTVEISQALTLKTDMSGMDTREKSLIKLSSTARPFFGEMSLFSDDDKRTATVKAVTKCLVGRISKEDFFQICNSNPAVGNMVMQNIARVLTERLKQANQNILKLTTALSLLIE